MSEAQKKLATGGGDAQIEEVGGVKLTARNLGDVPPRDLKGLADAIGRQMGGGVVALEAGTGRRPRVTGGRAAKDAIDPNGSPPRRLNCGTSRGCDHGTARAVARFSAHGPPCGNGRD